ncbi:MAG: protein kinase [Polyangiaceae bacterium]|nr:protein kinase [Polyangiaceae bacterium]
MDSASFIGRKIAGRFEIEAVVGEGAMGVVFRARQIALGTTVAVKVMRRTLNSDPSFAARFLREAQAASRIDHPSSMRVIDFGEEDDGLLFMVMEYLDGRTLADVIDEVGPLPASRIIDIASQILAALAVAHEMNVVHRDLKPENIMLLDGEDDEGRRHDVVKVCDFGVAKLLERENASSVTDHGLIVGTPAYMSPEQARGESLDARSDLYSMGVLLFQMMTAKVPFDATTAMATVVMHVTEEPVRPRELNPSVDERLEAICLKAMRKRPEDRQQNAREMRTELRALCTDVSVSAISPLSEARVEGLLSQVAPKPRRSGMVAAVAVAAFAILATVGMLARHRATASESVQDAGVAAPATGSQHLPSSQVEPAHIPSAASAQAPKPAALQTAAPPKPPETKSTTVPRAAKNSRTPKHPPPPKPAASGASPPGVVDEPLPVFPDPPAPEPAPAQTPPPMPPLAP